MSGHNVALWISAKSSHGLSLNERSRTWEFSLKDVEACVEFSGAAEPGWFQNNLPSWKSGRCPLEPKVSDDAQKQAVTANSMCEIRNGASHASEDLVWEQNPWNLVRE